MLWISVNVSHECRSDCRIVSFSFSKHCSMSNLIIQSILKRMKRKAITKNYNFHFRLTNGWNGINRSISRLTYKFFVSHLWSSIKWWYDLRCYIYSGLLLWANWFNSCVNVYIYYTVHLKRNVSIFVLHIDHTFLLTIYILHIINFPKLKKIKNLLHSLFDRQQYRKYTNDCTKFSIFFTNVQLRFSFKTFFFLSSSICEYKIWWCVAGLFREYFNLLQVNSDDSLLPVFVVLIVWYCSVYNF